MARGMSETYFLQYRNTEIEVDYEKADRIRFMLGPHATVWISPGEASQIATMLTDAAAGGDEPYDEWADKPLPDYAIDPDFDDGMGDNPWD